MADTGKTKGSWGGPRPNSGRKVEVEIVGSVSVSLDQLSLDVLSEFVGDKNMSFAVREVIRRYVALRDGAAPKTVARRITKVKTDEDRAREYFAANGNKNPTDLAVLNWIKRNCK